MGLKMEAKIYKKINKKVIQNLKVFFKFLKPLWRDPGPEMVPKSIQTWTRKWMKIKCKTGKPKSQKLASRLDGSTTFEVLGVQNPTKC